MFPWQATATTRMRGVPFSRCRMTSYSAACARGAATDTRFLVVSFDSDWRFPTAHSRRIHERLLAAGATSRHVEVASPWGHDSFLLEPAGYHDLVRDALTAPADPEASLTR